MAVGYSKLNCCEGKTAFSSRSSAKDFIRRRGFKGLHPYQCPYRYKWHIGHIR